MKPGDFPLCSVESRAAARAKVQSLAKSRPWWWVTVHVANLDEAKELARLFGIRGAQVLDAETGNAIPF